jgi:NAD(P)H-hydrate epimerase
MRVATAREMRDIDKAAIRGFGIGSPILMERAGLSVASKIAELYPKKKIIALCGSGNNGGDGIAAARNLHNMGFRAAILMLADKKALSPGCAAQYEIAKRCGVPIGFRKSLSEKDIHGAVVIDAVFGIGLARPVKGSIAAVFDLINKSQTPVVSVDISSGISSDTGEVMGEAIKAACTITFGLPKRGHFLYPGAEYTGRLFIEDIGFPSQLLVSERIKSSLIGEDIMSLIPQRQRYSHKGDYGHVLIIAGSRGKTGAALMAAKACLRSGAGLVTLGVPGSLMDIFQGRVVEEMTLPLPDDGKGMLSAKAVPDILNFAASKADIIAIGPGIGVSQDTEKIISELILKSPLPLVIDADGINSLNNAKKVLKGAKSPVVLTPHPGEMARLLKNSAGDIEKNRVETAISFAKDTGSYLVLKGAPAIVASPEGRAFINTTGNPGMATAGSGDVLTGIISSLLGQGLNPLNASTLGVYLHGRAGDMAAEDKGEHCLIASDIIAFLPDAFRQSCAKSDDIKGA